MDLSMNNLFVVQQVLSITPAARYTFLVLRVCLL